MLPGVIHNKKAASAACYAALALLCLVAGAGAATGGNVAPQRIVSLAPNITEILFALGLGDQVVAVTRYCSYPPAAAKKPQVGGIMDPSYERVLQTRPDLVILLESQANVRRELEKLGVAIVSTPNASVADIHESIAVIGRVCKAERAAEELLAELRRRAGAVQKAVAGKEKPGVLLCISREAPSGGLGNVFAAGRKTFLQDVIRLAGGENVVGANMGVYPQLSAEGIIRLNPEVIVELSDMNHTDAMKLVGQWSMLSPVAAVKRGRVHVVFGDAALRPGPRYVEFAETLAGLLHPDAFPQGANSD